MKNELIFRKNFLFLLSMAIAGLGILCGCLYGNNRLYKKRNEELIFRNDSLISVNARLQALLDSTGQPGYTKRKTAVF